MYSTILAVTKSIIVFPSDSSMNILKLHCCFLHSCFSQRCFFTQCCSTLNFANQFNEFEQKFLLRNIYLIYLFHRLTFWLQNMCLTSLLPKFNFWKVHFCCFHFTSLVYVGILWVSNTGSKTITTKHVYCSDH